MLVSRVRGIGLLLVVMLLVAIVGSQLIVNATKAKADPGLELGRDALIEPRRSPSEKKSEEHNNWAPFPRPYPGLHD